MTVPRRSNLKKLSTLAACCSVVPMSLGPGHMVSTASNATPPPPIQQASPTLEQAYPAFDPPDSDSPLTTSESSTAAIGIPAFLGALLVSALRKGRRAIPGECPDCGSAALANVGPVGAYRECYRCHTCGSLWNPAG